MPGVRSSSLESSATGSSSLDSISGASATVGSAVARAAFAAASVFVNINSVALERGEKVVDFFRGVDFGGQDVVYFVIEQVPALLAHGNELPYLIVFFFDSQRQGVLQK